MNRDIDLRPPFHKKRRSITATRSGQIFCLLCVVVVLLAGWGGLDLYRSWQEQELAALEDEATTLRTTAGPFIAVKEMREAIAFRSALEEKLSVGRFSRAEILRTIFAASSTGLAIEEIKIGADGVIEIQGTAPDINKTVEYRQNLLAHITIDSAEFSGMAFAENEGCRFDILATVDGCRKEMDEVEEPGR
ncbi:MAG: hypothetical protein SVV67_05575 [Bacillota bacterium]|nr:hypothetical protein [Bacillota bacterium]